MTAKIKAIGYCRWSPRPDGDTTQSNEKQKERIIEYCQQKGYELLDVIFEPDVSGGYDDNNPDPVAFYRSRPQLFDAMERVKKNMVLVMRWRDRAARSVHGQGIVRMEIGQKGARWEASDEPNDDSPEGRFMQQLYAGMAELKRWQIKIATARAMSKHQATGRRMSRRDRCPWGFKIDPADDARMVPDLVEKETTRLIMTRKAKGEKDMAICRYLDYAGRSRRGKTWANGSGRGLVRAIIKRAAKKLAKAEPSESPEPADL